MDNVIADMESHYIITYEKEYGIKVAPESLRGRPEAEAFPDGIIHKFLFTPGFFRTAPVMPGSREAIKKLMADFDIYIVSAAMQFPHSLSEKLDWISEHFPFIHWKQIIFCGDKSKINTDIMIDDHVKNLDVFTGHTIIYTASHNVNITRHTRADTWDDVLKIVGRITF